jgi:aspartyl-tRNA(Asn)/glutamyl-tRNA(Gln) amidotransferase subunit A
MRDTTDLRTITEIAPLVRAGVLSPVDLVRACLARIEARRELNAFITVLADRALDQAHEAEREIAAGRYLGGLHGIPVSVKDLVDVAGTPTTSASAVPARHGAIDAPIVQRLRDAGAIIVGKTNLHEFAFGTTGDETAFGAVHNPFDPSRSAGGSSSGAAVALVEGMCFGSVGTDTGGSIRIPSAACGTVGLKPTYGELPCDGIVPLSTTLDHVGPMTRTVADAALMFEAMSGGVVSRAAVAGSLTFGVPEPYFFDRLDPEVRSVMDDVRASLSAAGHTVNSVAIEDAAWTPDVYLHIVLPEAAQYHAPMLASHAAAYSPGVRLRIEMGRYLLAEDYVRAMRLRQHLTRRVDAALKECDALLLPSLPIVAPVLGAASVEVDGIKEPVRSVMLRLTQLFNITGHPAIAIPAGQSSSGLPLSLQLVGHRHRTSRLLDIAEAVEAAAR